MSGQRLGYIRVSSLDQNTQRQLDNIQLARVFTDKASGKDTNRPQLDALLRFARDGDTVLVHSMDRLARNLDDLRSVVRKLTVYATKSQARSDVIRYIEGFYNSRRRHSALGYRRPNEVHYGYQKPAPAA